MAQMIPHADGIVRDAPKAPEFNEYPKMMAHPAFQPGDIGTEVRSPGGYSHFVNGTPIRFPPVLVHHADDEEYYTAKGYVSQGKSDAAAFQRLAAAARPKTNNYDPVEYPKWAGGVLVNSKDEEVEALAARRVQLNIKVEPQGDIPTKEYIAPKDVVPGVFGATPDGTYGVPVMPDPRLAAMEAQIAELRDAVMLLTAAMQPGLQPVDEPGPTTTVEPIVSAPPVSKQQKAADTRKRQALAKAAAA